MKVKNSMLVVAAMLSAVTFYSCDGASRLAGKLSGSWDGAPEHLQIAGGNASVLNESLSFSREGNSNGGMVTAVADISASYPVTDIAISPVDMSVSSHVEISGTWTAVDDDELYVVFDPATLSVTADSESAVLPADAAVHTSVNIDSLKVRYVMTVKNELTGALQRRYMSMKHFDDVKVRNGMLKYEIGKTDYIMTRK